MADGSATLASLALKIDTREVPPAVKTLNDLTAAGGRAEAQVNKLAGASGRLATDTKAAAASLGNMDRLGRSLGTALGQVTTQGSLSTAAMGRLAMQAGPMLLLEAPILAAAAAVAGLGYAAYQADAATRQLEASTYGLGRATGLTAGQLGSLAEQTASTAGISVSSAEKMERSYIRMGVTNAAVFSELIARSKDYEQAAGVDAKGALEDLGKAFSGAADGADLLNAKIGGLDGATKALYDRQIKAGDVTGAQTTLLRILAQQTDGAAESADRLTQAWDNAKAAGSNFLRSLGNGTIQFFTEFNGQSTADAFRAPQADPGAAAAAAAKANAELAASSLAVRSAYDALLPKERQITDIRSQMMAVNKALAGGEKALAAAGLTRAQATSAIAAAEKKITDLRKPAHVPRGPSDVSESTIDTATKAEMSARMALTQNIETLAGLKREEVELERTAAHHRLEEQVARKSITASAAATAGALYDKAAVEKKQLIDQQTAAALVEKDLGQRAQLASYTDRTTSAQLAMAGTAEQANELEARALEDRQALEAKTLAARTAIQVSTELISVADRQALLGAQMNAAEIEKQVAARKALIRIQAEINARAEADLANHVDLLDALAGASRSATERRMLGERILKLDQAEERRKLDAITVAKGASQIDEDIAKARLAVLGSIHAAEQMTAQDKLQAAYREHVDAVDDMTRAFRDQDWNGLALALQAGFRNLTAAFGEGATAMDKVGALAGIAQGIGSAIGGRTGSTISGAASGAMAGMTVGGAPGAVIGAALGGLTSFLSASSARAEAKLEALRKATEDYQAAEMVSSDSIAKSLDEASRYQNKDLQYSNSMLQALRSINTSIGSVAASLANQISGGGLLSTSGLGLGSTSSKGGASGGILGGLVSGAAGFGLASLAIGGIVTAFAAPIALVAGALGLLVGALSKTKTTTELLDQGLQFSAATLAQVNGGGLQGQTYADLVSTTKKSVLGINYSTKVKTSTQMAALDPAAVDQISGVISALGSAVQIAASQFGEAAGRAAQTALEGATIDLGKLSLKGLTAEEIEKVLNATFAKVGDDLAKTGVPGLEQLQRVGEGALQTLVRVATEYQAVDAVLASIGKTFGAVGLSSLAARDNLVQLAGGLDALVEQTSFYAENFLTEAERMAPVQSAVTAELARLGLASVTTKDQFKAIVQGLDLSTDAGSTLYAALLAVAPAFAKVADYASSASEAVSNAADLAKKRRSLEIELMEAQGNAAGALTAKRADEMAALDASLRPLQAAINAANDNVAALDASTKAREAELSAMQEMSNAAQSASDHYKDLAGTLRDFAKSLTGDQLGGMDPAAAYMASRNALMSATGADIPDAGRAFLSASKNYQSTSLGYERDLALVRSKALAGAGAADHSATSALFGPALLAAMQAGNQDEVQRILGLPGFANGGSFVIGGNAGVDQNTLSLNGAPVARVGRGETVSVSQGNDNRATIAAVQSLEAKVSRLEIALVQIAENTGASARLNRRWDGDGLPATRSLA